MNVITIVKNHGEDFKHRLENVDKLTKENQEILLKELILMINVSNNLLELMDCRGSNNISDIEDIGMENLPVLEASDEATVIGFIQQTFKTKDIKHWKTILLKLENEKFLLEEYLELPF